MLVRIRYVDRFGNTTERDVLIVGIMPTGQGPRFLAVDLQTVSYRQFNPDHVKFVHVY